MKIRTPQNEAGWNLAPIDPSTGKIPPNLYDAGGSGTIDLTNYVSTGKIGLTSAKESTVTIKADAMVEGFENIIAIGSGACPNGQAGAYINLSSGGYCYIENGYGFYVGTQGSFYTISLSSNELLFNGHNYNTPNGLVVLGSDGKVPSDLYDAGGQSVFQVESFPTSGENNSLYIDKNTSEVKGYFNGAWQDVSHECVDTIDDTATVETIPSTKAVKDYVDSKAGSSIAYAMQPVETTTKDIVFKDNISIYNIDISSATTFTFDFNQLSSDACYTFELWVKMSTVSTLTFPSNVAWLDGSAPDMSEQSTYCIVVRKFPESFVTSGNAVAIINLAYKYNL